MNLKFDHLVHLTKWPENAKNTFSSFGFQTMNGGHHPTWGTYNCLCYFQKLRYIEWIGFTDRLVAKASDNPLIHQIVGDAENGEGFSQIAFRTDDIASLQKNFKEKGLETIGPFAGSRKKEDGTRLSWSMLFLKEDDHPNVRFPFFIQWGNYDEIRNREMAPFIQHEIGTPSLSYIGYFVEDAKKALETYRSILDCELTSVEEKTDTFGTYFELSLHDFSLRFYKQNEAKREGKPVICGITSSKNEKTIKVNGGCYTLTT